jgi:hypothetical protein
VHQGTKEGAFLRSTGLLAWPRGSLSSCWFFEQPCSAVMSLNSHEFAELRHYRCPSQKQDRLWSRLLHSMLFDARWAVTYSSLLLPHVNARALNAYSLLPCAQSDYRCLQLPRPLVGPLLCFPPTLFSAHDASLASLAASWRNSFC